MYTDYALGFNRGAKKSWTPDEDAILIDLVSKIGTKNWSEGAASLPGRVGKQCRERWYNHLDPRIKKGDWTPEEDNIIITQQRLYGNQWSKITKLLPGRTDNAVKNRWHATARARSHSSSQIDADSVVKVGRRRSRGSSIGEGDWDDCSADGRAASWAQRYSDSDLLLDAQLIEAVTHLRDLGDSSQPSIQSSHRPLSDSCAQTSSESSFCDEADDDVSEWAESLRGSASGADALANVSGQGASLEDDQTAGLMSLDMVLSFDPEYVSEAIGFAPSCDPVPQNIPVFCPAPKKPSSVLPTIDAGLDKPPVKRRHLCSPDMMETLLQPVVVAQRPATSSAELSRLASDDDMDALVQVMEMCMSPALENNRIAICSPDSMTMRGIEFDYLENMT